MKKVFGNKGLTLIEIIVTLAVLGVVITPLMSMFMTSQKINDESDMKYKAIQLAQQHIEKIKAMQPTLDTGIYPFKGEGSFGRQFPPDTNGYVIDVSIQKGAIFGTSDVNLIDVPDSFDLSCTISDTNEFPIDISDNFTKKVKININLPDGSTANIKINNTYDNVKFYIYKSSSKIKYNIAGNGTIIEMDENIKKPDNLLYEITVKVSKNGTVIDTIKGTTVFEIEPQA